MPMQLHSLSQMLTDASLAAPDLRVLNPNHENYTAHLLQPAGDIEADTHGVRNADQDLAGRQYTAFLRQAVSEQSALAITPEYSMPWRVVEDSLRTGITPAEGALWVLGCESTTIEQLNAFRDRVADIASVLYEPLTPQLNRFLDPVLYVFPSRPQRGGSLRLVIVVQFKTSPMGDAGHFEINGLQTGSRIYYFGNGTTQLRLATLICSDAFAFLDSHAHELYHRTLLIHVQLNKSPRHAQYRRYREKLLDYDGDETEVLCLNWAKEVHERCGGTRTCWDHLPCSAWYLRPDRFADDDDALTANHNNGMYYTWLQDSRCRALFFTYIPAVFAITASKVAHHGVAAALSRRRGPILNSTRVWEDATGQWVATNAVADGFAAIVAESGNASTDIQALARASPLRAERTLALCAGQIAQSDWYTPKKLDSCLIGTTEVMRRITACQDTDEDARQYRTRRLRTAHRVSSVLTTRLPAALSDLQAGFHFDWSSQSPHTNIVSTAGRRATAIYLGDEHTPETAYRVAAKAADYIGEWETSPNDIVEGRQRLHVWYRDDQGNDVLCNADRYVKYDDTNTESPFDITRAQ
ncbi:MAG: hypothetical protein JSR77_05815 [Planctomycetes bacterium]|nr:hypothetical protein [Planctomycetota bacterium]